MFLNAGYDDDPKQTDLFLKKPITYLILSFNTYDLYNVAYNGFPFDLGYASTTSIPCRAVANIVPKVNENLICKIETILTSRDYYIPIKLTVENFQLIELGTNDIEFHVLDMKWTGNSNNMAWVDFGIIDITLVPAQLIGLGASAAAMIAGSLLSAPHANDIHAPTRGSHA